jgi:hypothetical protein
MTKQKNAQTDVLHKTQAWFWQKAGTNLLNPK